MKKLAVALLLVLAALGAAQDLKDTYGKTNAQILAMGYDKWYAFYTKADGGESTASMSHAAYTYSEALAWRNDKLIAKLPKQGQTKVKSLRDLLHKFDEKILQTGMALTGGGTMWHIIGADAQVNLEEALYGVLGGKVKAAPAMVVSKATKALDGLTKAVAATKDSDYFGEFKKTDTLKLCEDAKDILKQIVAIAAGLDRKGSDHVLNFCYQQIDEATQQNPNR